MTHIIFAQMHIKPDDASMRWEDIETVAAVVRTGSFLAAARELGVQHSSISRRIAAIEEKLGETLFLRGRRLAPTALAREVEGHAADMAVAARRLDARLAEWRTHRAAEVAITTNDVLAVLLFRGLARARLTTRVRVAVTDVQRELEPGTTDLALRPSGAPLRSWRGRRLGVLAVAVFRPAGRNADPGWILPAGELRARASTPWLRAVPADGPIECDRILAMRDACAAGLGRAVLPAFLGLDDPRLELTRKLDDGIPVWLFAAGSRRKSGSVGQVADQLASALRGQRGVWA